MVKITESIILLQISAGLDERQVQEREAQGGTVELREAEDVDGVLQCAAAALVDRSSSRAGLAGETQPVQALHLGRVQEGPLLAAAGGFPSRPIQGPEERREVH